MLFIVNQNPIKDLEYIPNNSLNRLIDLLILMSTVIYWSDRPLLKIT